MSWWLWLLLALAVVLIIMLCSKIKLHVYYSRVRDNDRFYLGFTVLYGVFRYRFEVPVIAFKGLADGVAIHSERINDGNANLLADAKSKITSEKVIRFFESARDVLRYTFEMRSWVRESAAHVHCIEFKWDTRVGVGDAAETAITTGMIWSLKSSLLGFLFRFIKLDTKPQIQVTPQYNQKHFSMELSCVCKIRVAMALVSAIMLLLRIIKIKGGLKIWYRTLFTDIKHS